jgi:MtN3 and saliva related transmembrane protein
MPAQEIIGFTAAFFTMMAFLPQAIKSVRDQKTRDLSYGLLTMQSIGCLLWSIYGVIAHSYPIFIANFITFILVSFVLLYKFSQNKYGATRML